MDTFFSEMMKLIYHRIIKYAKDLDAHFETYPWYPNSVEMAYIRHEHPV